MTTNSISKFLGYPPSQLEELTNWVAAVLIKYILHKNAICPEEGLCLTQRYLASGDSHLSLESTLRGWPSNNWKNNSIDMWCALRSVNKGSFHESAKIAQSVGRCSFRTGTKMGLPKLS